MYNDVSFRIFLDKNLVFLNSDRIHNSFTNNILIDTMVFVKLVINIQ